MLDKSIEINDKIGEELQRVKEAHGDYLEWFAGISNGNLTVEHSSQVKLMANALWMFKNSQQFSQDHTATV
jgi:hypothetical protein